MKHLCLAFSLFLGLGLGDAFAAQAPLPSPSPTPPARPGKSFDQFPAISLEKAYDLALSSDQSIRIAYWEVRKANLLPWNALAQHMAPRLVGSADLGHTENTTRANLKENNGLYTTIGDRIDDGGLGLNASQPLIDAAVFPAYKIGKLSAQSARLEHQYTVRGVLFSVAKAYYEVLNQQRIVEVNRQALDLNEQQLDYAQKREAVGEVTRSDELRARVAVEGAHRTLIESENVLLNDRNLLANILNLPNDHFSVVEPKEYPASLESFEKLIATAYEHREDLKVAELTVEQDIQRHKAVATEYLPSVSAQWNGRLSESHSAYDSSRDSWAATISVDVPIFGSGGRGLGQRELDMTSTREQITQSRLKKESLAKQIQEDAKTAWLTTKSLKETLKALALQVQAAEQSYHDLDNQYRAGSSTSLDVLSALNELNVSRRDLSIQTYTYQIALRNLEQVSGVFQQQRVDQVKIR